MKHIPIKINTKTILADTFTPISIYLRLRDSFANALLLESSDYHTAENSFSFIALQPLAEIIIADNKAEIELPN
ncbi:MAG: anthranilate synthase component I family protein, partial [Bacteroidales bacterium]|nr:anthranilate synthase component I family protein [Bacteroidales bacterium]